MVVIRGDIGSLSAAVFDDNEPRCRRNQHSEGETTLTSTTIKTMAKSQNSQKQTKKQPLKTPAQKKADKRDKKNAR
jgi:hypothetical protein